MNTYNNFHDIRLAHNQTLATTSSVSTVKKGEKETLARSISQMSINTQMNFQNSETSELVLTELKCMRQEASAANKNVKLQFINFFVNFFNNVMLIIQKVYQRVIKIVRSIHRIFKSRKAASRNKSVDC